MSFDVKDWLARWSPGSGPTTGADVAALYTENGERWDPGIDSRLLGRESIAAFVQGFLDAVPDGVLSSRSVIRSGDDIAVDWTWKGTHTGDLKGWPADGQPVVLHGSTILETSGDLIAQEIAYWDAEELYSGRATGE